MLDLGAIMFVALLEFRGQYFEVVFLIVAQVSVAQLWGGRSSSEISAADRVISTNLHHHNKLPQLSCLTLRV